MMLPTRKRTKRSSLFTLKEVGCMTRGTKYQDSEDWEAGTVLVQMANSGPLVPFQGLKVKMWHATAHVDVCSPWITFEEINEISFWNVLSFQLPDKNFNWRIYVTVCDSETSCDWTACYDDIEFTKAVLNDILNKYCIDDFSIHMTGISNGGMFMYYAGRASLL